MFGEIVGEDMRLNDAGYMVFQKWQDIAFRSSHIEIDSFVVMPNHIHGIVIINSPVDAVPSDRDLLHVGAPLVGALPREGSFATGSRATTRVAPTLGEIIGVFKSRTTVEYVSGVKAFAWQKFPGRLWQRNYYEHIIRNEESLSQVRQYICDNPRKWALDHENPENRTP